MRDLQKMARDLYLEISGPQPVLVTLHYFMFALVLRKTKPDG
jgi:hypothetical protein